MMLVAVALPPATPTFPDPLPAPAPPVAITSPSTEVLALWLTVAASVTVPAELAVPPMPARSPARWCTTHTTDGGLRQQQRSAIGHAADGIEQAAGGPGATDGSIQTSAAIAAGLRHRNGCAARCARGGDRGHCLGRDPPRASHLIHARSSAAVAAGRGARRRGAGAAGGGAGAARRHRPRRHCRIRWPRRRYLRLRPPPLLPNHQGWSRSRLRSRCRQRRRCQRRRPLPPVPPSALAVAFTTLEPLPVAIAAADAETTRCAVAGAGRVAAVAADCLGQEVAN